MSEAELRHIWLCADDYGLSPAVSAAIRDLIARRRINATSVMMPAPSFSPSEASALDEAAAGHGAIGLHVTLTAPFRPLSAGFAPTRDGAFLPLAAMAGRALARWLRPEDLEVEIARQFAAFQAAFGRTPDYVDGHQHIHVFPQIREALLRVIKDVAPQAWLRQCGRSAAAPKSLSDPKGFVLDALSAQSGQPRRPRRRAHQSRLRRHLFLCAGCGLRGIISGLSRRPAGRRRRHVPSRQSRRRTAPPRSAHRSAPARIRLFSRRRFSAAVCNGTAYALA